MGRHIISKEFPYGHDMIEVPVEFLEHLVESLSMQKSIKEHPMAVLGPGGQSLNKAVQKSIDEVLIIGQTFVKRINNNPELLDTKYDT